MGAMGSSCPRPSLPVMWAWSFFLVLFCTWHSMFCANAQKCPRSFDIDSETVKITHCKHVGDMGATLSWTYNAENGSIQMAFKAKPATKKGWVAWGINPSGSGMVGTQALLAFRQSNDTMFIGTHIVTFNTTFVPSELSFRVTHLSSEYRRGTITLFATLFLPSNKTTVNQVWQVGSTVEGDNAFKISYEKSFVSIDLLKGKIPGSPSPASAPNTSGEIGISPSMPIGRMSPLSSSSAPSPSTSSTGKANAHLTISTISLTLLTLLTASACAFVATM